MTPSAQIRCIVLSELCQHAMGIEEQGYHNLFVNQSAGGQHAQTHMYMYICMYMNMYMNQFTNNVPMFTIKAMVGVPDAHGTHR